MSKDLKRDSKEYPEGLEREVKATLIEAKRTHKEFKVQAKAAKHKAKHEAQIAKLAAMEAAGDSDSEKYVRKLQKHTYKVEKIKRKQAKHEARKLRARFVAHVTIPDGTMLAPSASFVKVWRIRNDGESPWPQGTQFVFLPNSDNLGGPSHVTLDQSVQAEQEIEITLKLTAPEKEGYYEGQWKFCTADGFKFGQRIAVEIHVHDSAPVDLTPSVQSEGLHPSSTDSFPCGSRGAVHTTRACESQTTVSSHETSVLAEIADFEKVEDASGHGA